MEQRFPISCAAIQFSPTIRTTGALCGFVTAPVLTPGTFAGFALVVDLGGNRGQMAIPLAQHFPTLSVLLQGPDECGTWSGGSSSMILVFPSPKICLGGESGD